MLIQLDAKLKDIEIIEAVAGSGKRKEPDTPMTTEASAAGLPQTKKPRLKEPVSTQPSYNL
jgi:hypothetical protein